MTHTPTFNSKATTKLDRRGRARAGEGALGAWHVQEASGEGGRIRLPFQISHPTVFEEGAHSVSRGARGRESCETRMALPSGRLIALGGGSAQ
jgi:hypothetical protein